MISFNPDQYSNNDKVNAGIDVFLSGVTGKGGGKMSNKLKPYTPAIGESPAGPHTSFKTNAEGQVTNYAEYKPNSQNPTGFDEVKRVDLIGGSHVNKQTGEGVATPHVHGKDIPGGVRAANPSEIPQNDIKWKDTNVK